MNDKQKDHTGDQQRGPDQIIEPEWIIQIEQDELSAINAHPVITPILFKADKQEEQHLRESKRNHDEIDPAGPQCQKTDNKAQNATNTKA